MALPRPAGPKSLLADLRAFARDRPKHQWVAGGIAILMPVIIVVGFIVDARTNIAPGEQITYVQSWSSNRTDAEIKADQARRQAEREAAVAERQRQFKQLENRIGL